MKVMLVFFSMFVGGLISASDLPGNLSDEQIQSLTKQGVAKAVRFTRRSDLAELHSNGKLKLPLVLYRVIARNTRTGNNKVLGYSLYSSIPESPNGRAKGGILVMVYDSKLKLVGINRAIVDRKALKGKLPYKEFKPGSLTLNLNPKTTFPELLTTLKEHPLNIDFGPTKLSIYKWHAEAKLVGWEFNQFRFLETAYLDSLSKNTDVFEKIEYLQGTQFFTTTREEKLIYTKLFSQK